MTRRIMQYRLWTVRPDQSPDAAPTTHAMQCMTCEDTSETVQDVTRAQAWVLTHAGQHPAHCAYREIVTRPWRAVMGDRA